MPASVFASPAGAVARISSSNRSLFSRIMMGWVSGSPRRQLNSMVRGRPVLSIIRPAYRKPVKGMPSRAMPLMVGSMISRTTRACTCGVTTGAGE
jgi:hypothetical protein